MEILLFIDSSYVRAEMDLWIHPAQLSHFTDKEMGVQTGQQLKVTMMPASPALCPAPRVIIPSVYMWQIFPAVSLTMFPPSCILSDLIWKRCYGHSQVRDCPFLTAYQEAVSPHFQIKSVF